MEKNNNKDYLQTMCYAPFSSQEVAFPAKSWLWNVEVLQLYYTLLTLGGTRQLMASLLSAKYIASLEHKLSVKYIRMSQILMLIANIFLLLLNSYSFCRYFSLKRITGNNMILRYKQVLLFFFSPKKQSTSDISKMAQQLDNLGLRQRELAV